MQNTVATLEVITPEQASVYLEGQAPNRSKKDRMLEKMARDMANGEWRVNGETIKFFADGRLADGQNRLYACQRAGVAFTTWVVRGLDGADRETVDIGSARTLGDTLMLRGVMNANTMAGALGWYHRLRVTPPGILPRNTDYPTPAEALKISESSTVAASVERVLSLMSESTLRVGRASVSSALYSVFAEDIDKLLTDHFFEQVLVGTGLTVNSPIYLLRNRLTDPKARYTALETAALTIKAFSAVKAGRSVGVLKWTRSGPTAEKFPSWME